MNESPYEGISLETGPAEGPDGFWGPSEAGAHSQELKFMGTRKLSFQRHSQEESETLIPTLSICAPHSVSDRFWLSDFVCAPVIGVEESCFCNGCKNFPLRSLSSLEFYTHRMSKKCFLQPEVWEMEVLPRISATEALSEPSIVEPLTFTVEK